MKIIVKDLSSIKQAKALGLFYFTKSKPEANLAWKIVGKTVQQTIQEYFKNKDFTGANTEQKSAYIKNNKIFLLGLGEQKKWNLRKLITTTRRLAQLCKLEKKNSVTILLDNLLVPNLVIEKTVQAIVENFIMGSYDFSKYKDVKDKFEIAELIIVCDKKLNLAVTAGIKLGQIIGEQVNQARDLANTPGGDMTPTVLANEAIAVGKKYGFKVTVMNEAEIKKNKMGAILGVARGSEEKPKFIIMEYWGADKKQAPYVLVGKGVTFDTGGLNLKPEMSMLDMHLDMSGGAAVIHALAALAALKVKHNIVGLIPAVENMPGGAGYRPGDLIKGMSGKTIEVLNTDAEGRIILSDALTYAEKYNPKLVVDVATLTGACMVALGCITSGLMTPDQSLQKKLEEIGEQSGDYVWPLPMWEEYEDEIKGTFGDVQNIGKTRYGGAITGAMFLYQFAKKYSWAHIDIAGPMKAVEGQYLAKGASGVGVRFLVEMVLNYK